MGLSSRARCLGLTAKTPSHLLWQAVGTIRLATVDAVRERLAEVRLLLRLA